MLLHFTQCILSKEAQAGSMMPLTEEQQSKDEEDQGPGKQQQEEQILDTFNAENEALDTVRHSAQR